MHDNKVEICGVNTAKLPILKEKEKEELLKRVKDGDKNAREELINGNLRLVLSVIQRFTGRGENLDDLFQIGCIGLIKAIDNFDISQCVRFSTYAVPMDIFWRKTNTPKLLPRLRKAVFVSQAKFTVLLPKYSKGDGLSAFFGLNTLNLLLLRNCKAPLNENFSARKGIHHTITLSRMAGC